MDIRVIGGILLVIVSVVVGARVIGAGAHTSPVWAATRDLASGTVLSATDLVAVEVNLSANAARYLTAASEGTGVVGLILATPMMSGELLPVSAVRASPTGRVLAIGVTPDRMPPGVGHGSVIDLYLTTAGGSAVAAQAATTLVAAGIVVQTVTAPASGGLSGATSNRYQISVMLSAAIADSLVKALPRGEAIVVLVTGPK